MSADTSVCVRMANPPAEVLASPLRRRTFAAAVTALALLAACSDSASGPAPRIIAGVDFNALFAPPTAAERAAILAGWQTRDISAQGVREEARTSFSLGAKAATLRVLSHTVGGIRHYGAVIVADGAALRSLPVLVYNHGGDHGTGVEDVALISVGLGSLADKFVYVVPSFRSEPLRVGAVTYSSEGDPSPWDRDVDDALALMNAAIATTSAANSDRLGVIGFSRGGGVALLMGIRDPRISQVIEFFGPTDFFDGFMQQVTEEALLGNPRDLPGMDFLNATVIQPLKEGRISIAQARREMLLRSAVQFAERLPAVQVHHGTADDVVDVSQARSLISTMERLGRSAPEFEAYLYEGAGHDPLAFTGSPARTVAFLNRLLAP
jgi:acetyl esterase/lipase